MRNLRPRESVILPVGPCNGPLRPILVSLDPGVLCYFHIGKSHEIMDLPKTPLEEYRSGQRNYRKWIAISTRLVVNFDLPDRQ
jgi:hypothetical protein